MPFFKIGKFYRLLLIFLLFLGSIEIFLRIISGILSLSRYHEPSSNSKVILCLGDSYTFGGEVNFNESYPYLLNLLVKEKGYEVINAGICEADTSKMLERFEELRYIKPDKVIFLGGTANFFSYKREETIFSKIKVFKFFNIFLNNLKAFFIKQNLQLFIGSLPVKLNNNDVLNDEDYLIISISNYLFEKRDFKKAEEIFKEAIKKYPESINLNYLGVSLYFKIGNAEKLSFYLKRLESFLSNCDLKNNNDICGRIKMTLGELKIIDNNFSEGLKNILDSLYYLENIENYDVYLIKQAYSLQSVFSANEIIAKLNDIKKSNLHLNKSKKLSHLIDYFSNFEKNEKLITQRIKHDIKKLKKITEKSNSKLYLLTYPYPYKKVNNLIREIAIEEKIELIDVEKHFETLYEKHRKDYFKDFDHLNFRGNKILAELIYRNIF